MIQHSVKVRTRLLSKARKTPRPTSPTRRIRVVEAGHPVPDEQGEAAARGILAAARELAADDLLLVLVSGGGSSLLALPLPGIPMADLKAVTRALLASGAPIQDMNTVRKHLSRIQGGRLALATRARVHALVISDVTGDDPTHIASGPCAADPTTFADAAGILQRFGVAPPASIAAYLAKGSRGEVEETPKPGDPRLERAANHLIANAHYSLAKAADFFEARLAGQDLSDVRHGLDLESLSAEVLENLTAAPA